MKNKTTLGIVALGVIALLGMSLVAAFPMMQGNWDISEEEIQAQNEFMNQVQQSIENQDFTTWQSLMTSQITLENFNAMVEQHQEMLQHQEKMQQCIDDPDNCELEDFPRKGRGPGQGCLAKDSEDCPLNGQGPMNNEAINFGEPRHHRWAFWEGFNFEFEKNKA